MSQTVSLTWLKYKKTPEEKDELKNKIIENEEILSVLAKIVEERISSARAQQLSRSRFIEASWSESQADLNGYQRALEELKSLLTLERKSDHD